MSPLQVYIYVSTNLSTEVCVQLITSGIQIVSCASYPGGTDRVGKHWYHLTAAVAVSVVRRGRGNEKVVGFGTTPTGELWVGAGGGTKDVG